MALPTLTLTPNISGGVAQALNDGNPFYIVQEGFDIPTPVFDEEYAESIDTEGGQRVRSRPQNTTGSIPLLLRSTSTANLWTALSNLQQTVEMCRRVGGLLTYTPNGGTAVTYDVESIRVSGLPQDELHFMRARPVLEFTCLPFGRLASVSIVSNATSSLPIQSVSLPDIPGSVDALLSVTVTDTATQARDHLEVGLDDDWDGSSAVLIDSASLSASGLAGATATRTGAYSGASNNVIRATLATVPVGVAEATGLGHRGRHRIRARVYAAGTGPVYVRVAYRIGSGPWARNPWVTALDDAFHDIDLGIVKANHLAGTLTLRVEAYSTTAGDTLDVDFIAPIPVARYAKAKGTTDFSGTTYATSDLFNQSAGALAGKTADNGGTWSGAGDADDFSVEATGHTAQRTAVSDTATGPPNGRLAIIGSAITSTKATVSVKFSAATASYYGLLLRYVDVNNFAAAVLIPGSVDKTLGLLITVGGSMVQNPALVGVDQPHYSDVAVFHTLTAEIDKLGNYSIIYSRTGYGNNVAVTGSSSYLATGGALASGKVGLYDWHIVGTANTRNYDNFAAPSLETQNVVTASGAVILDHDSIARSDGTRPPIFTGSYMKAAPEGREGRTPRLAVKLRRTDVDTYADDQVADAQRVDVTATPRVALL